MATVFATWFGSETVLGIPARFLEGGLGAVVEDPFGSSACLVLVGMFFAARLYRMDLLTIGDFYRRRYDARVELLTSLAVVVSYLGWVAAQLVALGLTFNVLSGGAVSLQAGIVLGAAIVVLYTMFGGMFSVAWTDFMQMALIVAGLLYIAYVVAGEVGGVGRVVDHARLSGKLHFLPEAKPREVLWFLGALVTMMLGSIPQQDVFQRVTSARTPRIATWAASLGGVFYLLFAFVPIFLIPPHRSPPSPTPGGTNVTTRALFAALPALALFFAPVAAEAKAKKDTTVVCKDGTTDKGGRGACSGHGGVDRAATKARADAAPAEAAAAPAPAAAGTVTCKDGTTDTAGRGACSGHGGVDKGTRKSRKAKAAAAEAAAPAPAPAPAPRAAAPARPAAPAGEKGPPTAKCKDGTLSYAEHHTGACSNHGGVAEWLDGTKN